MKVAEDLPELLDALDPDASLVHRHLWLIKLVAWLRGSGKSVAATHSRLNLVLDALQQRPHTRAQVQAWWRALLNTVDATTLLADYGFASRSAFVTELAERIHMKLLPGTPETSDASALFSLVFNDAFDAQWIAALDETALARVADLLRVPAGVRDARPDHDHALSPWQYTVLEAITFCTSQIRAAGFSPELRLRMSAPARENSAFHALVADLDALYKSCQASPHTITEAQQKALHHYQHQLDACRHAASTVYTHLDVHGISVNLVFQLRQLRARVLRVRALLDCLFASNPQTQ